MNAPIPALLRRRLRIALVTETYPPEINGVAMTLGRMVEALRARGHTVQLVRPRQAQDGQEKTAPSHEEALMRGIAIPGYPDLKMGMPAKGALLALWRRNRPDIVHVATEGPLGWSALSAGKALELPVTSDFHTNFHAYTRHYGIGWLRGLANAGLRAFHNRALCTLVPTEALKRELAADGYRNLRVVARGVDTQLFHPARRRLALRQHWGVAEDSPVAVYVGRLAAEKNLPLVIETFRRMRDTNPQARLVFVGDGPERAALERRHEGFIFAGMRTGADLAEHYASADIFLFPSTTETYGNVTAEAMASGLAVVAFDHAAAAELIRHGENGLKTPPGDSRRFAEWGQHLATHPADVQRLRRNARLTAETLDWESIHDRFEHILLSATHKEKNHDATSRLSFVPD